MCDDMWCETVCPLTQPGSDHHLVGQETICRLMVEGHGLEDTLELMKQDFTGNEFYVMLGCFIPSIQVRVGVDIKLLFNMFFFIELQKV